MHFNLSRFVEIVDRVGGPVLAVIPGGDKIAPLVPKILHGIKEAQAMKGASGAEKKAHVIAIVGDGADVVNATGHTVSGDELKAIVGQGIDTVVEAVHVVEGAKATRPGEAPPAAGAPGTAAAASSLPGVDTAPRASDLPGGRATHGHGSSDDLPPAPPAPASGD